MKLRTIGISLALPLLALSTLALSTRAGWQDGQHGQDEEMPKPTKHHALLERSVGIWKATMDMPGMGIEGAQAVSTRKMIGKFWVVDDYEGEMMGMPFHGHGITGYDSEKEKYVGSWIDSWGDRMLTFEGTYDEATRTLRFEVPGRNPMTGEEQIEVHETRFVSDDRMTFRMLWPGEGEQGLMEVMNIRYERKK